MFKIKTQAPVVTVLVTVVSIVFLVLTSLFLLYFVNKTSNLELYKINSDCSERVQKWVKVQNNEFQNYIIDESRFDKSANACVADLNYCSIIFKECGKVVFDLTHNKELIRINNQLSASPQEMDGYNAVHGRFFSK